MHENAFPLSFLLSFAVTVAGVLYLLFCVFIVLYLYCSLSLLFSWLQVMVQRPFLSPQRAPCGISDKADPRCVSTVNEIPQLL